MKISVEEVSRALSVPAHDRQASSLRASVHSSQDVRGRAADQVAISPTAQEIQKIKKYIGQLPEVREARVRELKAQVESGAYHVSGEDIADQLLRRALADNTAL